MISQELLWPWFSDSKNKFSCSDGCGFIFFEVLDCGFVLTEVVDRAFVFFKMLGRAFVLPVVLGRPFSRLMIPRLIIWTKGSPLRSFSRFKIFWASGVIISWTCLHPSASFFLRQRSRRFLSVFRLCSIVTTISPCWVDIKRLHATR